MSPTRQFAQCKSSLSGGANCAGPPCHWCALADFERRARHPSSRLRPGGDLYLRPRPRAEMAAPLTWSEQQLARCWRYGELEDGSIGWIDVTDLARSGETS